MSSENLASGVIKGPTGFLTHGEAMLVVEDGRIYQDAASIGFLFEDGYLQITDSALGNPDELIPIDNIDSCQFRGIDSKGVEIVLPIQPPGPTGRLNYNGLIFDVLNGRVINSEHSYLADFTDQGEIYVRDKNGRGGKIKLDANTTLDYFFDGTSHTGEKCQRKFSRPLYRPDRTYTDNEIMRYFDGFDALVGNQKKYVLETMSLWSASGLLHVVRKSEGDASIGNVKHGATGVTRIRTGNVTLDKEEFEREINFYKQYGPMMKVSKSNKDYYLEVRLNLVVAHEFGHQVDFVLAQSVQEQVAEIYEKKRKSCDRLHAIPGNYEGQSELVMPQQLEQRHYVSGYAKASVQEYWAESLAAFSLKDTRAELKTLDPAIYQVLTSLILHPTTVLSRVLHETILALQASLRLGGEYTGEKLLSV